MIFAALVSEFLSSCTSDDYPITKRVWETNPLPTRTANNSFRYVSCCFLCFEPFATVLKFNPSLKRKQIRTVENLCIDSSGRTRSLTASFRPCRQHQHTHTHTHYTTLWAKYTVPWHAPEKSKGRPRKWKPRRTRKSNRVVAPRNACSTIVGTSMSRREWAANVWDPTVMPIE